MVSCFLLSFDLCAVYSSSALRPHLKRRDYRDKDGVAQGTRHQLLGHARPMQSPPLFTKVLTKRSSHAKVGVSSPYLMTLAGAAAAMVLFA